MTYFGDVVDVEVDSNGFGYDRATLAAASLVGLALTTMAVEIAAVDWHEHALYVAPSYL